MSDRRPVVTAVRAAGRAAVVAALLAGLVVLGLLAATLVAVARTPLPASLAASDKVPSVRVLDREGLLLLEVTSQGERVAAVRLATLPAHVRWAVLAAEDQRFYSHPGVDPLAMTRAAAQALWFRRLVSGASTITQQLARAQFERPRTLAGKWREMVVALRIERELDKDSILEAYLNRVDFAPRIQGLEAASRALFDKPAADLDLAEAALLVGLPRGPSLYDPSRGTERAKRRRDRILERLRELDVVPDEAIERALAEPVRLQRSYRGQGAQHLARALARGELVAGTSQTPFSEVKTTLDAALQREVESLARATIDRLVQQDASAASVLVIDNRSAEVLAYV
ncbi:MAG TPA: transglycosylase domain-containing protein, partial [Polyangiaceae bacterium]|nr:transglycosylase domain-containing protein [Polyangiaceae bacterium]